MTSEPKISRDEAEKIAQKATEAKLREYEWITPEQDEKLTLGKSTRDGNYYFQLYITGERPLDAVVISRTKVDSNTGAVDTEVFLPLEAG